MSMANYLMEIIIEFISVDKIRLFNSHYNTLNTLIMSRTCSQTLFIMVLLNVYKYLFVVTQYFVGS